MRQSWIAGSPFSLIFFVRTHQVYSGFILPPNDILIMKDGVKAVPREAGEIWLRGPNIMKGYFGDPGGFICLIFDSSNALAYDRTTVAATDKVGEAGVTRAPSKILFQIQVLTKDGWFKTGDLGCIDEEGYVYIKDRIKDIIIRGGENVVSAM